MSRATESDVLPEKVEIVMSELGGSGFGDTTMSYQPIAREGSSDTDTSSRSDGGRSSTFAWIKDNFFYPWNLLRGHVRNAELTEEKEKLQWQVKEAEQNLTKAHGEIQAVERENDRLKKEKEELLNRLSSVAGTKLKFNNPGITDLSDNYRPNKLAERLSELYDNDWTEAYDVINSSLEGDDTERETIHILWELLKTAFERCQKLAAQQRHALTSLTVDPSIILSTQGKENEQSESNQDSDGWSDDLKKKVSDFQKETAGYPLENVYKYCGEEPIFFEKYQLDKETCQTYFKKCVELCWYMNIQDPPLAMEFFVPEGTPYDTTLWREYTQSGEVVNYVVWPALFLNDKGPLLSKGVLQPTRCCKETENTQF